MEAGGSSKWMVTTYHTTLFYFMYDLFNNAVSSSEFTVSNGVMIKDDE
jgi:hypothetical protein